MARHMPVFVFVSGGVCQDVLDANGETANYVLFDANNEEAGDCIVCGESADGPEDFMCPNCGYERGSLDGKALIDFYLAWEAKEREKNGQA